MRGRKILTKITEKNVILRIILKKTVLWIKKQEI